MAKTPRRPEPPVTPFSIASQVTGPPFAHSLTNAALRQRLTDEVVHPHPVQPPTPATEAVAKPASSRKRTKRK